MSSSIVVTETAATRNPQRWGVTEKYMGQSHGDHAVGVEMQQENVLQRDNVRMLLESLDEQARLHGWKNQDLRTRTRRRLRCACRVQYTSPDGDRTLTTAGRTRDISQSGLGVMLTTLLEPGIIVQLTILLPDGKEHQLRGEVTFSRHIRSGWHLSCVQFTRSAND